jgi:hypothetical protein
MNIAYRMDMDYNKINSKNIFNFRDICKQFYLISFK